MATIEAVGYEVETSDITREHWEKHLERSLAAVAVARRALERLGVTPTREGEVTDSVQLTIDDIDDRQLELL